MYNLIEYSSNYSDTAGTLWFYSKDEATNFDADTANTNVLKNAKIAVPLKYLSNFWQSLEMPSINCRLDC